MEKYNRPNAKSQAHLREHVEFQSALQKSGFVETTQKVYLRAFAKFASASPRGPP